MIQRKNDEISKALEYWQRRVNWCHDHEEPLYVTHEEFNDLRHLTDRLNMIESAFEGHPYRDRALNVKRELIPKRPADVRINSKKAERQKRLFNAQKT